MDEKTVTPITVTATQTGSWDYVEVNNDTDKLAKVGSLNVAAKAKGSTWTVKASTDGKSVVIE